MASLNYSLIINKINKNLFLKTLQYSTLSKQAEYRKCYRILGIPEDSDQETIRKAYLTLVKKFHPDSGTNDADAAKFSEIDKAFKTLTNKKSEERWGVNDDQDVEEQDIKHTAPQHRQYLSYDGVGSGSPFQRQKQYGKWRAMQAAENVLQHRLSKVSAEEGALLTKAPVKHKIKTKYGFDRLVEDLIQESMSKGEFSNLSGSGKPLPTHQNRNPYVDFITHKLNEILIDNGFTPEWILLQKEIRGDIDILRDSLLLERGYFGPNPLTDKENGDWIQIVSKYQKLTEQINKKIDKFNLVVPIMNKQMIQINLENEAQKALINGKRCGEFEKRPLGQVSEDARASIESTNVFGFFDQIFGRK